MQQQKYPFWVFLQCYTIKIIIKNKELYKIILYKHAKKFYYK